MSDDAATAAVPGLEGVPAPDYSMFIADLGYDIVLDGHDSRGVLEITDELRVPGSSLVRISVLATLADVLTGIPASRAIEPSLALTVDLVMRSYRGTDADRLEMTGSILKLGSRVIVTEAAFREPGSDETVASCTLSFAASLRPQDTFRGGPPRAPEHRARMTRPFADQVGARLLAPGVVEVDRYPYVMQPAGTIQGGIVALLGELAGESVLGAPVTALEVRYLSTVRVGPARTTTRRLGPTTARTEVHDVGAGRMTALVISRV